MLAGAGLLMVVGSSAPQVAGAAEPRVEPCVQRASTGGCGGDPGLGRVLPHREAPKPCILPAVFRGGPLEPCGHGQRPEPVDPEIVPLHNQGMP